MKSGIVGYHNVHLVDLVRTGIRIPAFRVEAQVVSARCVALDFHRGNLSGIFKNRTGYA